MMPSETPTRQKSPLPFIFAFAAAALAIYWFQSGARKDESQNAPAVVATGAFSKTYATGAVAGVVVHDERLSIPPFDFMAGDGSARTLAAWKGRVILLNLWATWCAPCRKEMPDLADLQKTLGGPNFEVVALSVDKKGAAASAAFLKELGADSLAIYTDTTLRSMAEVQAIGLPATILIDRKGQEAARILGPAAWNSPEAVAMIKALIAEKP
jgi:thiol-disulfide isomerase/thioredoxin